MPNTRTSDVGQALPTSIDGPLLVADPADQTSFLKIDPAQARISAAGTARPQKRMTLGYVRTAGTSLSATLGTGMSCRQVAPGNDGGFHTALFEIPADLDVSEPASVYLLLAPAASSSLTGAVVRLEITAGYTRDSQATPQTTAVVTDHIVPDLWQFNSAEFALVDDGNARTFAPNTFALGDIVGLRIRLARSAAADTFDRDVKLGAGAVLVYRSTAA